MIKKINDLGSGEYNVKIIRESYSSCCGYNFLVKYQENTYFVNVGNVIYPNNITDSKKKYENGKIIIDKKNNCFFYFIDNNI